MKCACGQELHYTDEGVAAQMDEIVAHVGEFVTVRTSEGRWNVQRHYIALHGLNAADLPGSQFERIADEDPRDDGFGL